MFLFCVLGVAGSESGFFIFDAALDIKELDVGDLEDMESEVAPSLLQKLRSLKSGPSDSKEKMMFVVMTEEWTAKEGKRGTDKLSSEWTTLLSLGGVNVPIYSIDPGRLLITVAENFSLFEIKNFVFSQPNIDFLEVDQRPFFPPGRSKPLSSFPRSSTATPPRRSAPPGRPVDL